MFLQRGSSPGGVACCHHFRLVLEHKGFRQTLGGTRLLGIYHKYTYAPQYKALHDLMGLRPYCVFAIPVMSGPVLELASIATYNLNLKTWVCTHHLQTPV